jgi:hypothetical protein
LFGIEFLNENCQNQAMDYFKEMAEPIISSGKKSIRAQVKNIINEITSMDAGNQDLLRNGYLYEIILRMPVDGLFKA